MVKKRLNLLAAASMVALSLALAAQAEAATGTWDRTWGRNVNGGGVFGICTVASSCVAGTPGALGGELNFPEGIATDGAGNVYVADISNNRVQKFDSSGNWERAWGKNVNGGGVFGICTAASSCLAGSTGGLGGEMDTPVGVATDGAGNVYVADQDNNRVQKFDSSGNWERAWGKNVNGAGVFGVCTVASNCLAGTTGGLGGEMNTPQGVAVDGNGKVYVADFANHRIQKFDSSGNWERAWGKNVDDPGIFGVCTVASGCSAGTGGGLGGEMSGPDGVATDSGGNVFVIEFNNHRVQKFNSSGTWERAWGKNVNGGGVFGVCTVASNCLAGSTGGLGGEMNQPFGLAADANDNVYVSELSNQRIEEFDSSGTWERAWGKNVNGGGVFGICTVASSCLAGSTGGLGGEMNFPVGVASDSAGAIYLSDTGNSRIQRFGEPIVSQPPGSTPAPTTSSAPTGQRARAVRKCKRKFPKGPRRNKCIKKAKGLPV